MTTEPEYITIVEGPTPEFIQSPEFSIHSVLEGPTDAITALCEMRTMNGQDILERCRKAWRDGRPVRLDFPDEMRLRRELEVVGLRLQEVDEGTVLQVWVRQPISEFEEEAEEDGDDDGFFLE